METITNPVIEVYWQRYLPREFRGNKGMIGNEDFVECFADKKIEEYINYIFSGPPGTGKSLGADLINVHTFHNNSKYWNCSGASRKIEEIEPSILKFCQSGNMNGMSRKLAVLQEADGISMPAQKSFRVPMEAYAKPVVFILTVNYEHKIIEAVQDRCCIVKFNLAGERHLREFADRIIQGEGIKCSESQVKTLIRLARGHFRKVANILQGWTTGKVLHLNDLSGLDDGIDDLFDFMMDLKLDEMINKVEKLFGEFNSDAIVIRLAELLKLEDMPQALKTRSMKACTQCARDIVAGVDVYLAFYEMCCELVETMRVRKKNRLFILNQS